MKWPFKRVTLHHASALPLNRWKHRIINYNKNNGFFFAYWQRTRQRRRKWQLKILSFLITSLWWQAAWSECIFPNRMNERMTDWPVSHIHNKIYEYERFIIDGNAFFREMRTTFIRKEEKKINSLRLSMCNIRTLYTWPEYEHEQRKKNMNWNIHTDPIWHHLLYHHQWLYTRFTFWWVTITERRTMHKR